LLFLYYYSEYTDNQIFRSFADGFAEKILDELWTERIPTFCSGLSGILYLIVFLREQCFIDIDIEEVENDFHLYLNNCIDRFIDERKYDYMHGALGIGLYFLKHKRDIQPVLKLIDFLFDTAEKNDENTIFKWKCVINKEGDIGYNIALSHGISSIVLFLSRVFAAHIEHDKLYMILEGAINYLLSQERNAEQYGSFFPSQSSENENAYLGCSRLAWCYGDLGVAYSIWYAGKALNNKAWIDKGLNILTYSTKRKNSKDNLLVDAGLCHGSAGIAMVYNRLFIETENPVFMEAYHYWLGQTMLYATYSDGLAGYKTYQGPEKESECDYNLLTGVSGIGLMFLSYLFNENRAWDEMFLL